MMLTIFIISLIISWIVVLGLSNWNEETAAILFSEWVVTGVVFCIMFVVLYYCGAIK